MMKKIQNSLIRYSGLLFLFREIIQRNFVTIIFSHNWSVETGQMAIKYLSRNYNIISLNDYINFLEKPNKTKLPPKSLIVTIDDGYKGNYSLLPLIKRYKIPITIFLTAGIINSKKDFWFNYSHSNLKKEDLKNISNMDRINLLKKYGFDSQIEYDSAVALNINQILEMKDFVNFQSHTMTHPILPSCNDNEAKFEIFDSKEVLEKEFGLKINSIAFPNGDFSLRELEFVKMAGYKCSLTTEPGFNTKKSNIFRLKRISVLDDPSETEFAVLASGIRIYAFNFKSIFGIVKRKSNFKKSY